METRFLTTEQVSELLGVTPKTLIRSVKANEIPAVKIGKQYRFNAKAIASLGLGEQEVHLAS